MSGCKHCRNGWLENRFGQDVECVNGVLIDIDVASEGAPSDTVYPPAPCQACRKCRGRACYGDKCATCNGTGWRSGRDESQERLEQWGQP